MTHLKKSCGNVLCKDTFQSATGVNGLVDIDIICWQVWEAVSMADHFEKIQKLPEKIDGVPNFRRVPGYKVYCCGQPTIKGFKN